MPEPRPAGPRRRQAEAAGEGRPRAATALRLAQNLEKSGKASTALKSYKQILKDYPGTPAGQDRRRADQGAGGHGIATAGALLSTGGLGLGLGRFRRARPDPDIQADVAWSRSPSRRGPSRR